MFIVSLKSKPPGKPIFGVLSRIHRPHRAFGGGDRAGWDIIRACGHQAPASLDLGVLAFHPPPPSLQTPSPHLNVLLALKGPSSPVVPARVHPLLSKPRTHGKVPRAVAGMAGEEGQGEEGGQPRRPTPASNSRAGIPVEQQLAGLWRPE